MFFHEVLRSASSSSTKRARVKEGEGFFDVLDELENYRFYYHLLSLTASYGSCYHLYVSVSRTGRGNRHYS